MGGMVFLPLRQTVLAGNLFKWDDNILAVLPVLIAHENAQTRLARPGQERIATLAGVSKSTVSHSVNELEGGGWLRKVIVPIAGGRTRFEYRMAYARYESGDTSGRWIVVHDYIILRGIWAAMAPSTRRLYLVLLSLSWAGEAAGYTEDNVSDWMAETPLEENGRFVDASRLDPAYLRELAYIGPRTFARAWGWLTDNELVRPSEESAVVDVDFYREGVVLPFDPDRYAPVVMKRLEESKQTAARTTPGARRLITRSCKVNGHSQAQKRTRPATSRTSTPGKSDTREPEPVLEP